MPEQEVADDTDLPSIQSLLNVMLWQPRWALFARRGLFPSSCAQSLV